MLRLDMPESVLDYVRVHMPGMPDVMAARYEFALTPDGPKMIEVNAETPMLLMEMFSVSSQICRDFDLADPNEDAEAQLAASLGLAIGSGALWVGKNEPDQQVNVAFASWSHAVEYKATAEYLLSLAPKNNPKYNCFWVGLDDLRVNADGVLTASGERIDVMYKAYPTEYLIDDTSPDGTAIGALMLELIEGRKLAVFNPPISHLMQNKALTVIVWELHETGSDLLTAEEHEWVEQYMLPTYLQSHLDDGTPLFDGHYVAKPVYGREGDSVIIFREGEVHAASARRKYPDQLLIYQQCAPLPTVTVRTEKGLEVVHVVHNCFVTGTIASAVGVRGAPELIMDADAYWISVHLADDEGPAT
jgi:glutathionylspermidine synthase